ncbi:hypothetical protein TNCV_1837791 [Trichonephila clavipes]|nr:hypothetical protein TNCV_1837791 [Trichonephila clavipes]
MLRYQIFQLIEFHLKGVTKLCGKALRGVYSSVYLQRLAVQPDFAALVLLTDECSFSQHLDGVAYLVFRQEVLLQSVPANIKARIWFQHDRSSAHFNADVRSLLDTAYPGRWIERGGPFNWPARSTASPV